MSADTVDSLQASTTVSILSGILDIPLLLVALSLVATIYRNQERLVRTDVSA